MKTKKHNHSLTDILKFTLFACVMLLPIFAVATNCLYVIINKNAYMSFTGTEYDMPNAFYGALDSLTNFWMLDWIYDTAIYTAINTMTTTLDINFTLLDMLLTYWTMMTIIYVVFDIVIQTFTLITHMISEKTA